MTIYIINQVGTNLWKIGYTDVSVTSRLKSMRTGNPYPLEVYAEFPGTRSDETSIHDILSKHRAGHGGKEWFDLSIETINILVSHGNNPLVEPLHPDRLDIRFPKSGRCAKCDAALGLLIIDNKNEWCKKCVDEYNFSMFRRRELRVANDPVVGYVEYEMTCYPQRMCYGCMMVKSRSEIVEENESGDNQWAHGLCKECYRLESVIRLNYYTKILEYDKKHEEYFVELKRRRIELEASL